MLSVIALGYIVDRPIFVRQIFFFKKNVIFVLSSFISVVLVKATLHSDLLCNAVTQFNVM